MKGGGVACIWHSQQERNMGRLKRIVRERCNDMERQSLFLTMSEIISLVLYQEIKQKKERGRVY
jgi:hypothetical protein